MNKIDIRGSDIRALCWSAMSQNLKNEQLRNILLIIFMVSTVWTINCSNYACF
jgi:hypothetical protein